MCKLSVCNKKIRADNAREKNHETKGTGNCHNPIIKLEASLVVMWVHGLLDT